MPFLFYLADLGRQIHKGITSTLILEVGLVVGVDQAGGGLARVVRDVWVRFLDNLEVAESIVFKSAVLVNVFIHVIIPHAHGQNALVSAGIHAKCQVTLIIAFLLLLFSLSCIGIPSIFGMRFFLFLDLTNFYRSILIFTTFFQLRFQILLDLMCFY